MSSAFTILPLTSPNGHSGSNGFTHQGAQQRGAEVPYAQQGSSSRPQASAYDFLREVDLMPPAVGSRPTVRDADAKVMGSKLNVKAVAQFWVRGVLPAEIASILGVADSALEELLRSEEFSVEVSGILATKQVADLNLAIESTGAEALLALRDMMRNSANDNVRVKAATFLVDHARGKAPTHAVQGAGKFVEDPAEEIARLRKTLGYSPDSPPPQAT